MANGISAEFVRWSVSHVVVLALAALSTFFVLRWGCRLTQAGRYRLCRILAITVAAQFVGECAWRTFSDNGLPWQENLPLHFCSLMSVLSVIALWWHRPWACAVVYFGVLTSSIQGLITPALEAAWPSTAFIVFFLSHSLLLIVALAIPVLLGWRGTLRDVLRSMLIMDIYLLCIIPVNIWLGTNYGYTRYSPVPGCLLDYLGAAPWYYLWLQIPALAVFRLMLLPVQCRKKRAFRASPQEPPA